MNAADILKQTEDYVEKELSGETSGHDYFHALRTYKLSLFLQEREGGDRLVLGVASWLHDIHRIIQNKTGKYCTPEQSLSEIKKILHQIRFPLRKTTGVLDCVKYHEEYDFTSEGKSGKGIRS